MRVKILKRSFAGAEFAPDVRVLKVGGQSSAGVEKLEFELPAEWQGLSVTLHVQWLDGTLPAPVLLDDEDSVAVDKTLTASPGGQWMLLALGADGYRALTKPTKYECYSTLNTDGDVEISPTQYETFVARVLEYSNTAQQAAASAKTNAETAATAATRAVNAKGQAETAARTATAGAENSENSAARAEAAAARAEAAAPETGKVVSVNGKGGAVHLTAEDVGAMPASGAAVVQSIRLEGRTLTVTMADGSEKSFTTQDTTSLPAMTGVLGTEHGGTGKETPLTAEDVGAVEAGSGVYLKTLTVQGNTMTVTKGDGSTETVMLAQEYVLPAATSTTLGGVKIGFSLLLVCMMTGTVFCNVCSASEELMSRLDRWTGPINILFFVLSGAELDLNILSNPLVLLIGIIYIVFRSLGKISGSYISCAMTKCSDHIKKHLGITLLPQAGVALGMALTATSLADGSVVRNVVLFSVLVYELIGPSLTKRSLLAAGEIKPEGKTSAREENKPVKPITLK